MDVHRRNLMKGVLTGSTLLALGIPPAAVAGAATGTPGTSGRVRLLLGSDISDAEFAAGARTAFAANARHTPAYTGVAAGGNAKTGYGALEVVKLKSGLLNEYEKVANLLETFRDTRWVAVMDDGSAAVFTELVRNAGGSMVLLGSHVASRMPSLRAASMFPGSGMFGLPRHPPTPQAASLPRGSPAASAVFQLWRISFPPSPRPTAPEQTALPPASWAGAAMGRLPTQSRNQTQPTCIAREFRQRRGVNCSAGMELSPGRLFIRNPLLNLPVSEKTETKKEASPKACSHKPGPGWKRLDMQ